MPLYIVRWANMTASLVRADDEEHLVNLLDEVGDPGAAIWEEYDGPVWIEFGPKRHQVEPYAIVDDFDTHTSAYDILLPGAATADTCDEMYAAILERLFPYLHAALAETFASELSDEHAKAIIKRALTRELWHVASLDERGRDEPDPDDPNLLDMAGVSVLPTDMAKAMRHGLEDARARGVDIEEQLRAIEAHQRGDAAWREAQGERLERERGRAMDLADEELDD